MIYDELEPGIIETTEVKNNGVSTVYNALLLVEKRDINNFEGSLETLREKMHKTAIQSFYDFYSYANYGKSYFRSQIIPGFEETKKGNKIILENFYFIDSKTIAFQKVFFFQEKPSFIKNIHEELAMLSPIKSWSSIEIKDIKSYKEKISFVESFMEDSFSVLQNPSQFDLVRGTDFKKIGREQKLTQIIDFIDEIVSDPGLPGGPKKEAENIKVFFSANYATITKIELSDCKIFKSRIVFKQIRLRGNNPSQIDSNTRSLISDETNNYYIFNLEQFYNRISAQINSSSINFSSLTNTMLGPQLRLDSNTRLATTVEVSSVSTEVGKLISSASPRDGRSLLESFGAPKTQEEARREAMQVGSTEFINSVSRNVQNLSMETSINAHGAMSRLIRRTKCLPRPEKNIRKFISGLRKIDTSLLLSGASTFAASQAKSAQNQAKLIRTATANFVGQTMNDARTTGEFLNILSLQSLQEIAENYNLFRNIDVENIVNPKDIVQMSLDETGADELDLLDMSIAFENNIQKPESIISTTTLDSAGNEATLDYSILTDSAKEVPPSNNIYGAGPIKNNIPNSLYKKLIYLQEIEAGSDEDVLRGALSEVVGSAMEEECNPLEFKDVIEYVLDNLPESDDIMQYFSQLESPINSLNLRNSSICRR